MKPISAGIIAALLLSLGLSPVCGLAQDRSTGSIRMEGAQPPVFSTLGRPDTVMDHADVQWAIVDAEVLQLDKLVSLTTEQQAKASRIFAAQDRVFAQAGSVDGAIESLNSQIRAILTPAQVQKFDRTNNSGGVAGSHWAEDVTNRVTKWVGLSEEQSVRARAIYEKEAMDMDALTTTADASKLTAINQEAIAKVRELLTPAQQKRFDANPRGIACIDEIQFVESQLRSSDKIAGTFGTIKALALRRWNAHLDSQGNPVEGTLMYNVAGSLKSEYVFITWEKSSEASPIKILKVEAATGGSIAI
jgi:hypothetical protein